MTAIGKILVVRLSSIGDIILTTPLLRTLKETYPESHITFIIKKQYAELLSECPFIDELIPFNAKEGFTALRKIKNYLKEQHFDFYLDIHKNWRSRYLRTGIGAKKVTSYSKYIFRRTLLIWFKINLYNKIKPVYERYFDSVKELGLKYDGRGTEIHVGASSVDKARQILADSGYDFAKPMVILCPSATYFNKRWIPEGWIETAKILKKEKSAFVLLLGGPGDEILCRQIAEGIDAVTPSLAGKLTLSESAALLSHAMVVIANDSGLLHLAQSMKVPVVGIYGPTTRELGYFPIDIKSTVVETRLNCRPCTHNGLDKCPKKHFRCMKEIHPGEIIKAALQYIP